MSWRAPSGEIVATDGDIDAVRECLRSGWLTMGPRTQAFEQALAERIGVKHVVACSSGSAALHLACKAAGLGPGDEAIVPSLAFVAAAHAPRQCGADVVLCDSSAVREPGVEPAAVEGLIGPRTKAVIVAHNWGYPGAVEELFDLCSQRGLMLIEDCSEAIGACTADGAAVGSVGHLGCFSLSSEAQLPVGEGGFVATDIEEMAATARSLRSHAMTSVTWERHRGHGLGYDVTDIGFNYRLDEPRAALGLSRLERLADDIAARRKVAGAYRERLGDLGGVELPFEDADLGNCSPYAFPILVGNRDRRDAIQAALRSRGVEVSSYPAIHALDAYREAGDEMDLPVATEIGGVNLALPVHASLGEEDIDFIAEQLQGALGEI